MPKKNKRYSIMQLTDLHLTDDDDQSRTEPKVFGALKGMNARFRGLLDSQQVMDADLLLVTGDITDTGEMASWSHFWNAISESGHHDKTRVVLGNHDVASLKLFSPLFPRVDRSLRRWRYTRGLRKGFAPIAYPWCEQFFDNQLVIVALRSTQEDNVTNLTNAVGRLPKTQLAKLRAMLREHASAPYKIVTLHHPPCFPKDGSVNSFLHDVQSDEAESFIELCRKNGVQLIIHGHMHCHMDQTHKGIRIVGAAASTEPVAHSPKHVELCRYVFGDGKIEVERIHVPHRM